MDKNLKIGSCVMYLTPQRELTGAVITAVHAQDGDVEKHRTLHGQWPSVNLAFVSTAVDKTDPYGRQIERQSSICHAKAQGAPVGNCWLWPDET